MDTIDQHVKTIEKLSKTARLAYEEQCFNISNEQALKLENTSKKLTLQARKLPVFTWQPNAKSEIENCIKQNFQTEIGFTKEGWFCLRMPFLLPKKNGGSVDYGFASKRAFYGENRREFHRRQELQEKG